MIKTGIAGADSRIAGELIRILVNHPDIDLLQVVAPALENRSVHSFHHGLIGELPLNFQAHLEPEKLDVVFICPGATGVDDFLQDPSLFPELRIVDLSNRGKLMPEMVTAVSEIYRKPLVRGAKRAAVLHPLASMALVALYPLAVHLLLAEDIVMKVQAPKDIIVAPDLALAEEEIARRLSEVQNSFDNNLHIEASDSGHNRSTVINFDIPCSLALDEILSLYDRIYDDHNFSFMTLHNVDTQEVSGTQKCIITLDKPTPETLRVTAVADCRMRGGAGDAVHALNLLFGLHERTGLRLKSAKY